MGVSSMDSNRKRLSRSSTCISYNSISRLRFFRWSFRILKTFLDQTTFRWLLTVDVFFWVQSSSAEIPWDLWCSDHVVWVILNFQLRYLLLICRAFPFGTALIISQMRGRQKIVDSSSKLSNWISEDNRVYIWFYRGTEENVYIGWT